MRKISKCLAFRTLYAELCALYICMYTISVLLFVFISEIPFFLKLLSSPLCVTVFSRSLVMQKVCPTSGFLSVIHRVSIKTCHFYFLNKSVKQWPILLIFGKQHYEET